MIFFFGEPPEDDLPDDAYWDDELDMWFTPERPSSVPPDDRPWCPNMGYACPECGWERGHHPRCP